MTHDPVDLLRQVIITFIDFSNPQQTGLIQNHIRRALVLPQEPDLTPDYRLGLVFGRLAP